MIQAQLMYCPKCNVSLVIKNTTRIELGRCPLCNDALLIPAIDHILEPLKKLRNILRDLESQTSSAVSTSSFDKMQPYHNADNFCLDKRMN